MAKKILVCGGCGFMGSNFVRYLYQNYPHYQIYNLDLLTYAGNPDNLADIEKKESHNNLKQRRYFFIKGDISNKLLLHQLFTQHRFHVVINFAAESHVDRSIIDAVEFIRTNIQGAYILLEEVRHHRIPRFIYISTDEVYGDIPKGIKSAEDCPLKPSNPYAASKAAADLMVQSYIRTHRLPAIILRSSNNYGPYQYPEKLHPLVITNLIEGKKIPVHGRGRQIRSWIHVQDFCRAVDLMMHQAKKFSIYNVAGEEKSVLTVIKSICRLLNKDHRQCLKYVHDRPGADQRYSPNDGKIKKEFGWKRQYHYHHSLKDVVNWYLNHQAWWQKIKKKKEFLKHYQKQASGEYTFEENHLWQRRWTKRALPQKRTRK